MAGSALTYGRLRDALKQGRFAPLYLFFGEERYLMVEAQQLLIECALAPELQDFNLEIMYGPETETPMALARCAGYPMMAERRVVIIREFDKLLESRPFAAYAESPNPHAVVVLVAGSKPKFNEHPYRAIKTHGTVCEFKRLDARALPAWITTYTRDRGCEIDGQAIQMLVDYVGNDLSDLASELEKLITFVAERRRILPDDVVVALGQSREDNVFELQRAVSDRRYADALRISEHLLQRSPDPRGEALRILAVLGAFFNRLSQVAGAKSEGLPDRKIAELIKVRAYFLKDYTRALTRFGRREMEAVFSALLAADYELKGGSARDAILILHLMLARIIGTTVTARAA